MDADREIITSLGYWVRRRRKALDLTQPELARRVGCALTTLKKIERDERRPSPPMAGRLADHLALPPAERGQFLRLAQGEFVTVTLAPSVGLETHLMKHNLPTPATPFIGREKDLADVTRRLNDPACRLLTLVGPGGIGKTRLALRVAQRLIDMNPEMNAFVDGIFFVPLVSVGTASGIVAAIARAAGFNFYSNTPPKQQLFNYLREKRMLLLLDNFEHLLAPPGRSLTGDKGGGILLSEILTTAPGVKILVTSREGVNLQEAWFHPIAGLTFPASPHSVRPEIAAAQAGGPAERLLEEYDAIKLFTQSARRSQVGFSLAAGAEHVVHLCQRVEGMPLALELAAAWLKILPIEKIIAEIERGLDLLTAPYHNVPERHRSMRAVFEHSWRLLSERERDYFKRLSVFRGSFDQVAAEQVAGASLTILAMLVEKSLLQVTAGGRYQLHELIRQFAAEKLAQHADEETATRKQHSDYYLGLLKAREKMLTGKAQRQALDDIEQELHNVEVAWRWAVGQDNLEVVAQVLDSLYLYYQLRSRYREGQEIFAHAAAKVQHGAIPLETVLLETVSSRLSARQGAFCYYLGDFDAAEALLQASLTPATPPGEAAFIWGILGEMARLQGNPTLAQECVRRSLALSQESGALSSMAKALNSLAQVNIHHLGQHAAAKQLVIESLSMSRQLGRPDSITDALNILVWSATCLGDYDEAEAYLKEHHAICLEMDDPLGIAISYNSLGWLAVTKKDASTMAQALVYSEQAVAMFREIGHRPYLALSLGALAFVASELGECEKGLPFAREGAALAAEIDSLGHQVHCLCFLGAVELGLGQTQAARQHLLEALQLAYVQQMPFDSLTVLFYLGALWVKESDAAGVTEPVMLQQKAKALELMALLSRHPMTEPFFKDKAARLQAEIEMALPAELIAAARARGENSKLEDVLVEILH
jgi:predicted ATPase/transcriptional regulator with XRE-family HTH domain